MLREKTHKWKLCEHHLNKRRKLKRTQRENFLNCLREWKLNYNFFLREFPSVKIQNINEFSLTSLSQPQKPFVYFCYHRISCVVTNRSNYELFPTSWDEGSFSVGFCKKEKIKKILHLLQREIQIQNFEIWNCGFMKVTGVHHVSFDIVVGMEKIFSVWRWSDNKSLD